MGPSLPEESVAHHRSRPPQPASPKSGSPIRHSVPASDTPTTFFMRSGEELEQLAASSASQRDYGIRSLTSNASDGSTIIQRDSQIAGLQSEIEGGIDWSQEGCAFRSSPDSADSQPGPPSKTASTGNSPSRRIPRPVMNLTTSGLLTPQLTYSPNFSTQSAPISSPKSVSLRSLRLSDDEYAGDDAISQAMTSGGEEEEEEDEIQREQLDMDQLGSSVSQPELVMPSIRMPSRRPFTDRGKTVGKLKVMIVGAPDVGKTSLIKAIMQSCEDIVHVDPTTTTHPTIMEVEQRRKKNSSTQKSSRTQAFIEVHASSRAYPSWWSELDENRVLRRRYSNTETVLERNLCFVDTPALIQDFSSSDSSKSIQTIMLYVEKQFQHCKRYSSLSEAEAISILTGSCSSLVDLVIYIVEDADVQSDWDAIALLSRYSTVLPILGKADQRSEEQIEAFRTRYADYTTQNQEDQFLRQVMGIQNATSRHLPNQAFAVSSAASNEETMDASLLMSSEYVQPLVPSDISDLLDYLFDADVAAMLRHISTKHFLRRRGDVSALHSTAIPAPVFGDPPTRPRMASAPSPSPTELLLQRPNAFAISSPYLLARLSDHMQREERIAQVRLAQWATDLQKSLRSERQQFRELEVNEQKGWLIERWDECVAEEEKLQEASSGRLSLQRASGAQKPSRRSRARGKGRVDVVGWTEAGRLVLQVIGGCGIIGAAAVWIVRITGLSFGNGLADTYFIGWWNSGE